MNVSLFFKTKEKENFVESIFSSLQVVRIIEKVRRRSERHKRKRKIPTYVAFAFGGGSDWAPEIEFEHNLTGGSPNSALREYTLNPPIYLAKLQKKTSQSHSYKIKKEVFPYWRAKLRWVDRRPPFFSLPPFLESTHSLYLWVAHPTLQWKPKR